MRVFAETSFLCALLRTQDNSHLADAWMSQHGGSVDVTTLVLFEFSQGVQFQVWLHKHDKKKGYSAAEAASMLAQLGENLELGIFRVAPMDWTAVHNLASRLAARHTPKIGARGFDLLHVASASEWKADLFLSMDGDQRQVAKAEGLRLAPIMK